MTRTAAREIAIRISYETSINPAGVDEILDNLFSPEYYETLSTEDELYSDYPDEMQRKYIIRLASGIYEHSAELDGYIEKYAKTDWKFSRISRTAAAIMRAAMYEILYMPDIPNGAAVNEAVELTKKYDAAEIVSFVNGILGSFIKGETP